MSAADVVEEVPQVVEDVEVEDVETGDVDGRGKLNRMEKKARKALQKMGMKPVSGIQRVTIKKSKTVLFVISQPDVFRMPNSDTYAIFGDAKIEDMAAQAQAQAAQQYKAQEAFLAEQQAKAVAAAASVEESDEPDEEVDESGLDSGDIEMIMQQAGVKRSVAVKALRENEGDIVNTIMELTSDM